MRSNPRIPSEVWFVSDNGLVTSADDGESFWPSVPITVPMDGVRSMLMLDVGRILMSGRDGVMETTDGGVTWRLFNRGLSHADDAKLFSWGPEGPHALSGGSVYRLGPAPIEDGSLERVAEWVPVGALVDGAVDRIGMEMVPDLRRRRVAAWLSPILTVEGRYRDNVVLGWNRYSGSRFDTRGEAIGLIRFYWRPRNRTRSDVGVLTNGSRPLIIAGGRDGASALRLNQQLASYRADLADRIVGLFRTRRNLVIEREQMMEADLLEQVVHELMIRHIEADLDALSGNMVSRWRDR